MSTANLSRFVFAASIASVTACGQNGVVVVEEFRPLANTVDTIQLIQDSNDDGTFAPDESVFVFDPSGGVQKTIRVGFLRGVSPATLDGAIELGDAFPCENIELESPVFEIDPTDPGLVVTATYDIVNDGACEGLGITWPIRATFDVAPFDDSVSPLDPKPSFIFVAGATSPSDPPPRVVGFSPGFLDLPGWSRPIDVTDIFPGTLSDALQRLEASNFVSNVMPHDGVRLETDKDMTNLAVSITPSGGLDDLQGIRLGAAVGAFFDPFTKATSDTSVGMMPYTEYVVTIHSRYSTSAGYRIRAPMVTGSQASDGSFIMPFLSNNAYDQLKLEGYTNQSLALDTQYRFQTGPLRISSIVERSGRPRLVHRTRVGLPDTDGGMLTFRVHHVRAAGFLPPEVMQIRRGIYEDEVQRPRFLQSETLSQDGISQDASFVDIRVPMPSGEVDEDVVVNVGLLDSSGANVGDDVVKFNYDSTPPDIDPDSVVVTNTLPNDGSVDELCIVSSCDTDHFVISAEGGTPVTLEAEGHETTSCVDGSRAYCFYDVPLGLPPNGSEGSVGITITAVDDVGNASDPVVVTIVPECIQYEKFIDVRGALLSLVTLPEQGDGRPGIVASARDGRSLRFFEGDDFGNFSDVSGRAIHELPDDTDDVRYHYGLNIDSVAHPGDGQPVVCLVEGAFAHEGEDNTEADGQLLVVKRQVDGTWTELFSRLLGIRVRPLNCSLSVYGNGAGVEVTFVAGLETSESSVERIRMPSSTGSIQRVALPVPEQAISALIQTPLDLDSVAGANRTYYVYRLGSPFSERLTQAGALVVGYANADGEGHAEILCPIGESCATSPLPDPGEGLFLGFGPVIDLNNDFVTVVAAVSRSNVGLTEPFDPVDFRPRRLTVLRSPRPESGGEFHFALDRSLDSVLGGQSDDRSIDGEYYSYTPIAIEHDASDVLNIAWARKGLGSDTEGSEDIAVTTRRSDGHYHTVVVDARVADSAGRVATPPALSVGAAGFKIAFRNPLAERVVYADEESTELYSEETLTACAPLYETRVILEDELNLMWEHYQIGAGDSDPLFRSECLLGIDNAAADAYVPRPGDQFDGYADRVGLQETLLNELLAGATLEDGRVLQKRQAHVCYPDPEIFGDDRCDPDRVFEAPVPETVSAGLVGASAGGQVADGAPFENEEDARDACQPLLLACNAGDPDDLADDQECVAQVGYDPAQLRYTCHVCPEGSFYDGVAQRCETCNGFNAGIAYSNSPKYDDWPAGVIPETITIGSDDARCVNCPLQEDDELGRGQMRWLASTDGLTCSRCPDGLYAPECSSDRDCLVLGDAGDFRCLTETEAAWDSRANSPGRVCVKACVEDSDCDGPGAQCISASDGDGFCLSDYAGDGIVCRDLFGNECTIGEVGCSCGDPSAAIPSARQLACRPIGCDTCWQNDFCDSESDCPLNHVCLTGEPAGECDDDSDCPSQFEACAGGQCVATTLTPACLLRPILSPTELNFIQELADTVFPGSFSPETRTAIEDFTDGLQHALQRAQMPNAIGSTVVLHDFRTTVKSVDVSLVSSPAAGDRQGRVEMKFVFSNTGVKISVGPVGIGEPGEFQEIDDFWHSNEWYLKLVFSPFVQPGDSTGPLNLFDGIGLELVEVSTNGYYYPVTGVPLPLDGPGALDITDNLKNALDGFAGPVLEQLFLGLGVARAASGEPVVSRCLFTLAERFDEVPDACPMDDDGDSDTDTFVSAPSYVVRIQEDDRLEIVNGACQ